MPYDPNVTHALNNAAEALMKARQEAMKPPYPFCCHAEKCIAAGRCERTVKGERWCCAD